MAREAAAAFRFDVVVLGLRVFVVVVVVAMLSVVLDEEVVDRV